MGKRPILAGVLMLLLALPALAQGTIDQYGVYHPTEEEVANNNRIAEMLRRPIFIALRLVSIPRDVSFEKPSDTPPPFKVKDLIHFQLLVTQNSFERLLMSYHMVPHSEYRPELIRDGDLLSYTAEAQRRAERYERDPPDGSSYVVTLEPGHEVGWSAVRLDDWYDPLGPGHYQLIVRKRFAPDGDWVESNPVIFDVQPRNPASIPATVTVELLPQDLQEQPRQKSYALRNDVYITVFVANNSDKRITVEVIDSYYANQLKLFRDGGLIPLREEIQKLIHSREENPGPISGVSTLFLEPHSRGLLQGVNLTEWYGQLAPGHYKLVNRRRFEIDGPWTTDSIPLLFEVTRPK